MHHSDSDFVCQNNNAEILKKLTSHKSIEYLFTLFKIIYTQ